MCNEIGKGIFKVVRVFSVLRLARKMVLFIRWLATRFSVRISSGAEVVCGEGKS